MERDSDIERAGTVILARSVATRGWSGCHTWQNVGTPPPLL
jgi:hypothetical protein